MRKLSMKRKSKSAEVNSEEPSLNEDKQQSDVEDDLAEENENLNSSKKNKKKNRRSKKSNNLSTESNGASEDAEPKPEQYEVEAILNQKFVKGARHFLIRWKGYNEDSDTWEPENTVDCPELVTKFLATQKNSDSPSSAKKSKKRSSQIENKSSKKVKTGNDEQNDVEEYEVDRIIEVHHKKNGKREFLVHWKGYTSLENTWEPEDNMNCPDLIDKFMAKVNKARETGARELRVNRKPTRPFTLSMVQSGRRLSRRNLGKQRAQYRDNE